MLVTPSQRAFADAHRARRRAFFPSSRPKRLPPAETPLAGKGSGTRADRKRRRAAAIALALRHQPAREWKRPRIEIAADYIVPGDIGNSVSCASYGSASQMERISIPTVANIQRAVCFFFNVTMVDLLSERRIREIVRPRQIAMYLAKTMTLRSLPDIGRRFGGRDHTTVLHGFRKIDAMLPLNPDMAADIEAIKAMLRPAD